MAFRGTLGRLATVGQTPLPLDVYRWFLATLSPFPVFQQYTLLFTVANGAIAQQCQKSYSSYYTYLTYEQFYWQNLANCKRQDTKHCRQW